ncbi:MAG: DUF3467 domain-containing protein [Thermoleophilia bacterium]|jgi:hypothetical protein
MAGSGPAGDQRHGKGSGKPTEIKVRLTEEVASGTYANTMLVQHSREEFVMDFIMTIGESGVVVSRVVTSPAHMKRIVHALEENLRKYEAAHGLIQGAGGEPPMILRFPPTGGTN